AVQCGHKEVAKLLLENGAHVNGSQSCSDWNPLHQASLMGRTDILQLLLEHGADKECVDDFGITPTFIAAQYGKSKSLNMLLLNGTNVNCQAKDKATPLFIAAQEGHNECVKLLLSNRADPNLYCNDDNWQLPIHAAAEMRRSTTLELLLPVTDPSCGTQKGKVSPVYSAIYGGDKDCLEKLLMNGYSPEAQNCPLFECESPMCMVFQRRNFEAVPILLKFGFRLSSVHLQDCLVHKTFDLFRYFLSQHCTLPSGNELEAFMRSTVQAEHDCEKWLPDLFLAGFDPLNFLNVAWIGSAANDLVNFTLEFTNWKRLPPDVENLLSTHTKASTWSPKKHFGKGGKSCQLDRMRSPMKSSAMPPDPSIHCLYVQSIFYTDVYTQYGIPDK
ncbi:hypothetical protein GDO86_017589, partial [Hymenochirus boettgeri]